MSAGPANALRQPQAGSLQIARSAVVVGTARLGEGSLLAEGAVIRSDNAGVEIGTGSAVLENSVVIGNTGIPTTIGRRTVVKQRSQFAAGTDIDGFPAVDVGRIPEPPPLPAWALRHDDLPAPTSGPPVQ